MSYREALPQPGSGRFLTEAGMETWLVFQRGIELVALALPLTIASMALVDRALKAVGNRVLLDPRRLVVLVATVPFIVAGVSLMVEAGGGVYWVLGGVIGAVIGGVMNAWVLLVETLR